MIYRLFTFLNSKFFNFNLLFFRRSSIHRVNTKRDHTSGPGGRVFLRCERSVQLQGKHVSSYNFLFPARIASTRISVSSQQKRIHLKFPPPPPVIVRALSSNSLLYYVSPVTHKMSKLSFQAPLPLDDVEVSSCGILYISSYLSLSKSLHSSVCVSKGSIKRAKSGT